MGTYFRDLYNALVSSMKGMSVTLKHLFSKPVTVQYPDEKLPIADAFLGKHELRQEKCIYCQACAKICPVDCLDLDADRHPGKVLEWRTFTVNYNHCMFCGLCVESCPTEAILMTKEYDLSRHDRMDCLEDLLEWKGLREGDREKIEQAKKEAEEKKQKAAEAKAKKEAAAGKKDEPAPAAGGEEKTPPAGDEEASPKEEEDGSGPKNGG